MFDGWLLELTVWSVKLLLSASIVLVLSRLVRGPSLPDRVVALDMLAVLVVAIIAVDAIATGQFYFLRAGIVLAIISFVGTIAFALYLQRGWQA